MKKIFLVFLFAASAFAQTTVNGRRSFSGSVNAQTTTYQVLAADFNSPCGFIPVASGTFTITLVASGSQPPAGQCVTILNYGTGVVTLARSGQNINGAASNLTGTAGSATAPTGWTVTSDGTNYEAQVIGSATGLSISGAYITDGTNFYTGPHNALATIPPVASFSWLTTQGGASETTNTGGSLTLVAPSGSDALRMRGMSMGANTTLTVKAACTSAIQNYQVCAPIILRESSTGKMVVFGLSMQVAGGGTTLTLQHWASATSFGGNIFTASGVFTSADWVALRAIYTAGSPGTLSLQVSADDLNWQQIFTENATAGFTTGPNQWGYGGNAESTGGSSSMKTTLYSFNQQ